MNFALDKLKRSCKVNSTNKGDMKMPNPNKVEPFYITADKTAEVLGLSSGAVRQLIHRKKIKFVKTAQGKIQFDINDVVQYHANRMKLPSWELHQAEIKGLEFVSIDKAAERLQIATPYALQLLKKKMLVGYVTSYGDIMISKTSVNAYLKAPDSDTDDL